MHTCVAARARLSVRTHTCLYLLQLMKQPDFHKTFREIRAVVISYIHVFLFI